MSPTLRAVASATILAALFAGAASFTSTDGSCSAINGGGTCPSGLCCSQFGWCGTTAAYCGSGCQPLYGNPCLGNSASAPPAATSSATKTASRTASRTASSTNTATAIPSPSPSSATCDVVVPSFSIPGGAFFGSVGDFPLTISSPTPGAFLYVTYSYNPAVFFTDVTWIEDAGGVSGPSLSLTVPYNGGGIGISAKAGRGGCNSSVTSEAFYMFNSLVGSCKMNGTNYPEGRRCFAGDCSSISYTCDGNGGLASGYTVATDGSLCVGGVLSSSWPAATCPNNRCYRSNPAYEAGQAWACLASPTPTATATATASKSAPPAALTATATSSVASLLVAAAPTFSLPGGPSNQLTGPTQLTIRSATPGGFLYVTASFNPNYRYVDALWAEDTTGAGPSVTLTIPPFGGGILFTAHAGRGGLLNSSDVAVSYYFVPSAYSNLCSVAGVNLPAGPTCFAGDCSSMYVVCDGAGSPTTGVKLAPAGLLCVGGYIADWPAATCPNNRCYFSNQAYEAGQAWACLAFSTPTATSTASATKTATPAAATATSTSAASSLPTAAVPTFSSLDAYSNQGGLLYVSSGSPVSLTISSTTPYGFLYVGFTASYTSFMDSIWVEDTTGAGPSITVLVPVLGFVNVLAHAGRGGLLNSSTAVASFVYANIGVRACKTNGVSLPAGPQCFAGDCSPITFMCDGAGNQVGSYTVATDGSLCVGGAFSNWPAATCPNNRCYHSNPAYEAGQAWDCLASTTATATATSTASKVPPPSATSTASASSSPVPSTPPTAATPSFSVPGSTYPSTFTSLVSLTIRSSTPGGFIYASVYGNPSLHYLDFLWAEDATGVSGPTLTLTVPYIGGGTSICAVAGRGGLTNSSQVCQTYRYNPSSVTECSANGVAFPAGARCFGGDCSPVSYYCDGTANGWSNLAPPSTASLYTTYPDTLCVGGVLSSSWPASTCPNNRCYRSNSAYEAGQAWDCLASTTATSTSTATKTATPAAASKTTTATAARAATASSSSKSYPVSSDGLCGVHAGSATTRCGSAYCCSQWGYCGLTSAYCGTGCQSAFSGLSCSVTGAADPAAASASDQALLQSSGEWATRTDSSSAADSTTFSPTGSTAAIGTNVLTAVVCAAGAFVVVAAFVAALFLRRRRSGRPNSPAPPKPFSSLVIDDSVAAPSLKSVVGASVSAPSDDDAGFAAPATAPDFY